eukprot:1158863-Pelagomonas_calceolata.AAC.2
MHARTSADLHANSFAMCTGKSLVEIADSSDIGTTLVANYGSIDAAFSRIAAAAAVTSPGISFQVNPAHGRYVKGMQNNIMHYQMRDLSLVLTSVCPNCQAILKASRSREVLDYDFSPPISISSPSCSADITAGVQIKTPSRAEWCSRVDCNGVRGSMQLFCQHVGALVHL